MSLVPSSPLLHLVIWKYLVVHSPLHLVTCHLRFQLFHLSKWVAEISWLFIYLSTWSPVSSALSIPPVHLVISLLWLPVISGSKHPTSPPCSLTSLSLQSSLHLVISLLLHSCSCHLTCPVLYSPLPGSVAALSLFRFWVTIVLLFSVTLAYIHPLSAPHVT